MSASIKRLFERTPSLQTQRDDDSSAPERAAEERTVQLGIVVDRVFQTHITEDENIPDAKFVWLFVPARTSRRSIERLASSLEGMPRFYVRIRCLVKYVYSDRFDVAFNLADHRYYLLPIGTLGPNIELMIDQNPAILEFVRARSTSMGPSS